MNHRDLAVLNLRNAPKAPTDEWRIVLYFYAAVHAVNHVLFSGGLAPKQYDHRTRREALKKTASLKPIHKHYVALESASKKARYFPDQHPVEDYEVEEARDNALEVLRAAKISVP